MIRASLRLAAPLLLAGFIASGPTAVQAAPDLPTDLNLVPRDAAAFLHIRAADLYKSDDLADLRRVIDKAGPEATKVLLRKFAPDPSTIDRVTVVHMTARSLGEWFPSVDPEAVSALVIVSTTKPYDRARLRQTLGLREKMYRQHLYYFNEDLWSGLLFVDAQNFVIGSEDALVRFLNQSGRNADGPLAPALAEAAGKHQVTVGLNSRLLAKEDGVKMLPPPFVSLLESRCIVQTLDFGKGVRSNTRIDFAKDEQAVAGEKALQGVLAMARMGLAQPIQFLEMELNKEPEEAPVEELAKGVACVLGLGMLRDLDGLLKEAKVKRDGTAVSLPLQYRGPIDSNNTLIVGTMFVTTIGRAVNSTFTKVGVAIGGGNKNPEEEHLKKLAEAMEKCHKEKGAYPPAASYDADGRPLLSWRVHLLPYLGQEGLHKEFRLDEPWDSLHNKRLLKKLPDCYKAPSVYHRFKTVDVVCTGDKAAFAGSKGPKKDEVGDKTTLVATVEADPVYWTKPADLAYADDKPLDKLFGKYKHQKIRVLAVDGTFQTFDPSADEKAIRAAIKRSAKQ